MAVGVKVNEVFHTFADYSMPICYIFNMRKRFIVGIDEAGRGPLAGPVSVAVLAVSVGANLKLLNFNGHDSKKLSPTRRSELFTRIREWKKIGHCRFAVSFTRAPTIDKIGISKSVKMAISRCLRRLAVHQNSCKILLDGSLKAPPEYKNQKTIIRGDELVPIIALASVLAKVTRDRHMVRMGKIFPKYQFHVHKGYGTRLHYRLIKKHGLCPLHRRSFLKVLAKKHS